MKKRHSKKKRGISAIVATVLLILITIAGVGIIWGVIMPLFGGVEYLTYSDVELGIVFEGYTVYDAATGLAFVQVKRGSDSANLAAIDVIFEVEGNSYPYRTTTVPEPNEKKTYSFNLKDDGVTKAPTSVSVSPVIEKEGGTSVVLQPTDDRPIPIQTLKLTEVEVQEAQNNAETPKNAPETIKISACAVLSQTGNYELTKDIFGKGPCITINASGVKFDGKGYTIKANDSDHGWGGWLQYGSSIYISNANNLTIKNVKLVSIAQGIYSEKMNYSILTNINSSYNDYNGIWMEESSYNLIENSVFTKNGYDGIWIGSASDYNTFQNNIINENGYGFFIGTGQYALSGGKNNMIKDNQICNTNYDFACDPNQQFSGNTYDYATGTCTGFQPSVGSCTTQIPISSCKSLTKTGRTYFLYFDIYYNTANQNCININADNIYLDGRGKKLYSNNNSNMIYAANRKNLTIVNMTLEKGLENLYFDTVTDTTIRNVTSISAKYNGFKIWNSKNITFESNKMSGNHWDAIWFYYSHNNTMINNNMSGNGWGLWFENSRDNKINLNRICNRNLDLECRPNGYGSPQTQIDLGSNTYSTQNQCAWVQASAGSCN
jgi:flagellin-like protein